MPWLAGSEVEVLLCTCYFVRGLMGGVRLMACYRYRLQALWAAKQSALERLKTLTSVEACTAYVQRPNGLRMVLIAWHSSRSISVATTSSRQQTRETSGLAWSFFQNVQGWVANALSRQRFTRYRVSYHLDHLSQRRLASSEAICSLESLVAEAL